jgi:hypothetical protein
MSLTALMWIIAYAVGAILAFSHPIFGLFVYFMDYYAHPPLRWWGKALPDYRWALIIAIITLVAYLIKRNSLPKLSIRSHPQTKWLIFFIFNTFLIIPLAVWPEKNMENIEELVKLGILYLLIIKIVRSKEHFRYMIIFHILGIFDWGWNAFDDPKRKSGRLFGIGGPDSLQDNGTAAHLLAILPFIMSVFNTFILANSRGAFVALLVTGVLSILLTKGPIRQKTILAMLIAGVVFYNLIDNRFIQRQQTIQTYEEDNASIERIESWKGALNLIQDYPLGTGGGGYEALSPIYIPEIVEAHNGELRGVHNTFLAVASEWGIQGFVFFMGFLASTFWELWQIRKAAPHTAAGERIRTDSLALTLGLIGVLTAGFFINRLYAEAIYWLTAFTAALRNIQAQVNTEEVESMQYANQVPYSSQSPSLAHAGS